MEDNEIVTIGIYINDGTNLPKADLSGSSDPYCIIHYETIKNGKEKSKKVKTEKKSQTLSPTWHESFVLKNVSLHGMLVFDCFDWDNALKFSSDDYLGSLKLKVEHLGLNEKKKWRLPLFDNGKSAGNISFSTYVIPSKDYNDSMEKELKSKCEWGLLGETECPLFVLPHQHRLTIYQLKTVGFLLEKDKSHVYARITIGKQILETMVDKKKGDRTWTTPMEFSFKNTNQMTIQLKDWKVVRSDTSMGSVTIDLMKLLTSDEIYEKSFPISGGKGKLHIKLGVEREDRIKNTIPIGTDGNDDGDQWTKQNIPTFEKFQTQSFPKGIVSEESKNGYNFECEKGDISDFIDEKTFLFNDDYYEKPIHEIIKDENKKAYCNTVSTTKGPIVLICGEKENGISKAISISQYGKFKTYIKDYSAIDEEVMKIYGLNHDQVKMKELNETIWKKLENYESRDRKPEYKFGLLYAKPNQKNELEFLSNKEPSFLLQEFYNLIGRQIELKGYQGYRGGLDVTNGTTGTHSLVAKYRNIDIMFHVSTMLVHEENDPQKLQKKRHIGNDVCVIIFKERSDKKDDEVDLTSFRTQFNHVFIIVTPITVKNVPMYQVTVCTKSSVKAFLPKFPKDKFFKRDQQFVDWLLCKIINAERVALESPQFIQSYKVAHKGLLDEMIKESGLK